MSVLILSRDHAFLRSMYYELCIKFFVILLTFIQGLKFHDIPLSDALLICHSPLTVDTLKSNQPRKTICSRKQYRGCDSNKCYRSPWAWVT